MKLHDGYLDIPTRDAPVVTAVEADDLLSAPGPVIPYTVFTRVERRTITWLIGCSMFFSPFTVNIYFPCLEQLQHAVGVNSSLINLTITTFVIVQAVAPAFFGDMADNLGRRPVYLVTFSIYVCANLALALQSNYAALMVLRGLQSLGCSATVAIGYGVVADIATPATRGSILGPAMIATNLGPSIGPLVGGVLAAQTGWRGAFWLLVIIGTVFLAIWLSCSRRPGASWWEMGVSRQQNGTDLCYGLSHHVNKPLATIRTLEEKGTVFQIPSELYLYVSTSILA